MPARERSSLSVLILAGGQSRGVGRDKAWVQWTGKPLIVLAVDTAHQLGIRAKRCHALARGSLARSRFAVRDFAAGCLRERAVTVFPVPSADAGCFANWNRPADLNQADARV